MVEYLERSLESSLVAQRIKRLPAIQETQVQFLGQEDPLEKEKTHRRKHNGNFHDIEFHNGILDMTPKGNTLDLIKI